MATYKEIKGVTVQTRDSDPVLKWRYVGCWWNMNTGRNNCQVVLELKAAALSNWWLKTSRADANNESYTVLLGLKQQI